MRDSFPRLLRRCFVWAAVPTFSSAEWVYGGLGTAVTTTAYEACKRYWGLEVSFPDQAMQAVVTFITVCILIFITRLILSPFFVWRQDIRDFGKREKEILSQNEALSRRVETLTSGVPRLVAEVNEIAGGGYIPGSPEDVPLILVVTIKNLGNYPTIVDSYQVEVVVEGRAFGTEIEHMPMPISLSGTPDSDIVERTFFPNDAIYIKTSNPIPMGSMVQGFLYVNIKGFDRENFLAMDVNIMFKDIFGNEYSAKQTPRGKPEGASFHPQMRGDTVFRRDDS